MCVCDLFACLHTHEGPEFFVSFKGVMHVGPLNSGHLIYNEVTRGIMQQP